MNRLTTLHQTIHPRSRIDRHLRFLPDQAEDLVNARHLGKVDVGDQTPLLQFGDLLGVEVCERAGADLTRRGLYLDLPGLGAQLFHFEPRP